jgi:antibiotic biosynthesis monooxygenase (ABM) superfamily enzyme
MQGYVNLKGYGEFDNNARPDGFNAWLTFALSPKAPPQSFEKSMATK